MKNFLYATFCVAVVFASSCKKDSVTEQKPLVTGPAVDTLRGIITTNTTLTKNTFIDGIVFVDSTVTLTINAGITMFGKTTACGVAPDLIDLADNKGTLVIQRGAKLIANGTPTQPIVWTSTNPQGSKNTGDWGGIVINGAAPIVTTTGLGTNVFEAFTTLSPAFVNRSRYGGSDAADNSGSMKYNRIEFCGGIVTQENQETNGLTLCGVGNGTTLDHIEVLASNDDGFEFFGGTVNAKYLLSFATRDDDFDFDEAYRGNLQFIIAYRTNIADQSGSELIELDGNGSATNFPGLKTRPFIANATLIGPASTVPAALCPSTATGRFDGGIYVRRQGRLVLLNSLVIAQAFPTAFATTATTNASFFGPVPPPLDDNASAVISNIFQTTSANPVVIDGNEGNPIITPSPFTGDAALINRFSSQSNTALGDFASFNLGALIENKPNSPSFSGGINLASLGLPFFTGTTQRGAVPSNDVWTNSPWISIASN